MGIVLELEAHIADELGVAEVQRQAVGEVRLHVEDEVLALGPFLLGGRRFEGLDRVHFPVVAVDHVAG